MEEQNTEKQFRKDVLKAKAKYRKRRKFLILSIMSLILVVTLIQTFLYTREKKQLNTQLSEQEQTIKDLEKENKVNEILIDKLKDPYFIADLVRQEYGLSYEGEIIFNLPLEDKFLQAAIKAITEGDLSKPDSDNARVDDSKIPALNKDKENENKSTTNNKVSDKDNTKEKEEDNQKEEKTTND